VIPSINALWASWEDAGIALVAPGLLHYEVANALHQYRKSGARSTVAAAASLRAALELPITLHSDGVLHERAMNLAERFSLGAAYDAHYLALAERLGAEFWTADRRLANSVRHELEWVRLAEGEESPG
jgi:predicted nucleic acid-binding protein